MSYEPPHLRELVKAIEYKPGWMFALAEQSTTTGPAV